MRWPTNVKWSIAASIADLPISDPLTIADQHASFVVSFQPVTEVLGELWKDGIRAHLIGPEESIFDHWYFGRTVLVGVETSCLWRMWEAVEFGQGAKLDLRGASIFLIFHRSRRRSCVEMFQKKN